ncbi:MAG TPA: hypothetical protein VN901_20705, partial [Candidatus Acidoferrales bacterium]|nr:hypothetical protein [Candidatus Acidoferrales bacterium]
QRNSLSVELIHPATIASSSRLQREVRLPDLQCLRTNAFEQSRSLIHRRTWQVPAAAFNVLGPIFLRDPAQPKNRSGGRIAHNIFLV